MKTLIPYKFSIVLSAMLIIPIITHAQSTWVVSQAGDGNFLTIQGAVDNSESGDIIYVKSGLYQENVSITKNLILEGEDAETTIIDAQDTLKCISVRSPLSTTGTNNSISNFTFINSGTGTSDGVAGAAIALQGDRNNKWDIINNIFIDNERNDIISRTAGIIANNVFRNSTQAIITTSGSSADIINNVFINNNTAVFAHVFAISAEIYNNIFIDNDIAVRVLIDNGMTTELGLDYNLYWNNTTNCFACNIGNNSMDADPLFDTQSAYDFYPSSNSPLIDAGLPDLSSYDIPNSDFAGFGRVTNDRIDIGLHEFGMTSSIENTTDLDISIFPNPTDGQIVVRSNNEVTISVSTMLGEKLIESKEKIFSISNLNSGVYLLQVVNNHKNIVHSEKVVKI